MPALVTIQIWRYHVCIDKQVSHLFSYLSYHQCKTVHKECKCKGCMNMHHSNHLVWCFMIIFLHTSRSRLSEPIHVICLTLEVLPVCTGILPVSVLVIY
jgi:hypothetical protein